MQDLGLLAQRLRRARPHRAPALQHTGAAGQRQRERGELLDQQHADAIGRDASAPPRQGAARPAAPGRATVRRPPAPWAARAAPAPCRPSASARRTASGPAARAWPRVPERSPARARSPARPRRAAAPSPRRAGCRAPTGRRARGGLRARSPGRRGAPRRATGRRARRPSTAHAPLRARDRAGQREHDARLAGAVRAEQRDDLARPRRRGRRRGRRPCRRAERAVGGLRACCIVSVPEVGLAHGRVVEHVARRPEREAAAEVEHQGLRADGGDQVDVVVDQQHLRAEAIRDRRDRVAQHARLALVEPGARLVEQDQPRLADQRLGHLDHAAPEQVEFAHPAPRRSRAARRARARDAPARRPRRARAARGRAWPARCPRRSGPRPPARSGTSGAGRSARGAPVSMPSSGRAVARARRPPAARTKPLSRLTSVVLPAPFGPIRPHTGASSTRVERVDGDDGAEGHGERRGSRSWLPLRRPRSARKRRPATGRPARAAR